MQMLTIEVVYKQLEKYGHKHIN